MTTLRAAVLSTLLTITAIAPRFHAAPTASDKATAQVLFDEALKLLDKKQYADACRKLEESNNLDPQMGTKYKLADCFEKVGRTASAWVLFREVMEDAKAANLADREKKARERAAKLEPKLSKMTILVNPANGSSLSVKRDGTKVGEGQWGTAIAIDPGAHTIEASAEGKRSWSTTTDIADGASVSVNVPVLEASTPAVEKKADAPPRIVDSGASNSQKTAGIAVASIGVVAIGVSTYLVISAKSLFNDANPHCSGNACDETGLDLRDRAHARGNVATVVFGLGTAALLGGGVLLLTAPDSSTPPSGAKSSVTATIDFGAGWLALRGRF